MKTNVHKTNSRDLETFCKDKLNRKDVVLVKNAMWNLFNKQNRKNKKNKTVRKKQWMCGFHNGFLSSCRKRNSRRKPRNYE